MIRPQWSLLQMNGPQGGFQNALAQGWQMGSAVREQREQEAQRNALAEYATNPTQEGLAAIAPYNPQFAIQERQRYEQEAQAQKVAALRQGMASGDQQAAQNLQALDFDTWSQLNEAQQGQAAERAEVIGQSALRIARIPPEQRAQAWDSAIAGLSQQYPELQQYMGQYSEQALNAAIDSAGLVNDLWQQTRQRLVPVERSADLIDMNDPNAAENLRAYREGIQSQGPRPGAIEDGYMFRGGDPADPANWEQVGGSGGNATGGFPGH